MWQKFTTGSFQCAGCSCTQWARRCTASIASTSLNKRRKKSRRCWWRHIRRRPTTVQRISSFGPRLETKESEGYVWKRSPSPPHDSGGCAVTWGRLNRFWINRAGAQFFISIFSPSQQYSNIWKVSWGAVVANIFASSGNPIFHFNGMEPFLEVLRNFCFEKDHLWLRLVVVVLRRAEMHQPHGKRSSVSSHKWKFRWIWEGHLLAKWLTWNTCSETSFCFYQTCCRSVKLGSIPASIFFLCCPLSALALVQVRGGSTCVIRHL